MGEETTVGAQCRQAAREWGASGPRKRALCLRAAAPWLQRENDERTALPRNLAAGSDGFPPVLQDDLNLLSLNATPHIQKPCQAPDSWCFLSSRY